MKSLNRELRLYLDGRTISARPNSLAERLWRWCRRRPLVAALSAALAVVVMLSMWSVSRIRATQATREVEHLTSRLLEADPSPMLRIVEELSALAPHSTKYLQERLEHLPSDAPDSVRLTIALARMDAGYTQRLVPQVVRCEREVFPILVDVLADHGERVLEDVWRMATDAQAAPAARLKAYCAAAFLSPDDPLWDEESDRLADLVLSDRQFLLDGWVDLLRPVAEKLYPPVASRISQSSGFGPQFHHSLDVYLILAQRSATARSALADTLAADARTGAAADDDSAELARARSAIALLRLDDYDSARHALDHSYEPVARNYAIHGFRPGGIPAERVFEWLQNESNPSARQALLLAIGSYDRQEVSESLADEVTEYAVRSYRNYPEACVRSAAEWLLRQWGSSSLIATADRELTQQSPPWSKSRTDRNWHVDRFGNTLIIFRGPTEINMGKEVDPDYPSRTVALAHSFAIASKEVTMGQFDQFVAGHPGRLFPTAFAGQDQPEQSAARPFVSWYGAAFYCNWLSERDGLPSDQWCYLPNEHGEYSDGMRLAPDFVHRTGYRLPMEAEWLIACGVDEDAIYCFGRSANLLDEHCWSARNSENRPRGVGLLKPNCHGLFDLHGNVFEWCLDRLHQEQEYDVRNEEFIQPDLGRCLRGGSYIDMPKYQTLGYRNFGLVSASGAGGIRLVRTLPEPAAHSQ